MKTNKSIPRSRIGSNIEGRGVEALKKHRKQIAQASRRQNRHGR